MIFKLLRHKKIFKKFKLNICAYSFHTKDYPVKTNEQPYFSADCLPNIQLDTIGNKSAIITLVFVKI